MLPQELLGRPPRAQHAVLNALWFVAVTGVQWRLLPREFPPCLHPVCTLANGLLPLSALEPLGTLEAHS